MDAKNNGAPEGAPITYTNKHSIGTVTGQRVHANERKARQDYIENKLNEVLKVKSDFEDVKYGRDTTTDREYLRTRDIFGGHITIEITNLELCEILDYVCWVILKGFIGTDIPVARFEGIVHDKTELRRLASIFK